MSNITKKVIDSFIVHKVIAKEDSEIYLYGLNQGIVIIFNLATTLVLGYLFGAVLESAVFIAAYIPVRCYAGGYHSKTPLRCYILSVFMIATVLYIITHSVWSTSLVVILTSIGSIIIALLAPVEDKNKPLDKTEQAVFKKRTLLILGVLIILTALSWIAQLHQISASICMALIMLSVMLVMGKKKNTHL